MKKILIGVIAIIVIGITTFLVEFIITYQKTAVNLQAAIENYDIKTVSEYLPGIKTTYIAEEDIYVSTEFFTDDPGSSLMLTTEPGRENYDLGILTTNIVCSVSEYPPKSVYRKAGVSPWMTPGNWSQITGYDDVNKIQRYTLFFEPRDSSLIYSASCSEKTNTIMIVLEDNL